MRIHHATLAKAKKFQITLTIEENEVIATSKTGVRLAAGLQGNKVLEDAITKATGKPAKGRKESAFVRFNKLERTKARRKSRVSMVDADGAGEEPSDEELGEEVELEAEEEGEGQSKSIVKAKYRALYKPHKDRSGDTLSHDVNKHVSRENDDGETKVDLNALRRFAKANGTWVESYASLRAKGGGWNSGQAIMNTNNRLRAKIRQANKVGEEFEIKWV